MFQVVVFCHKAFVFKISRDGVNFNFDMVLIAGNYAFYLLLMVLRDRMKILIPYFTMYYNWNISGIDRHPVL